MLKFPRKEERKNEQKGWEKKGKKGREEGKEGERKKEGKVKGQSVVVYWERRRTCVKTNEGTWLAARKKKIFEPYRRSCFINNS